MSAKLRSNNYERMSQQKLDSLINKRPDNFIEREHVDPKPILHSEEEYDTLHPEMILKEFCSNVRGMLGRYESNKERLSKLEQEMQDLLHYVEMSKNKNALDGFKLYKRLCDVRRERRSIKNEIDLLQPVYDLFHGTKVLDQLTQVQGTCRTTKQAIDNRAYTIRTDILEDFIG